jgi:hypothetical protein
MSEAFKVKQNLLGASALPRVGILPLRMRNDRVQMLRKRRFSVTYYTY